MSTPDVIYTHATDPYKPEWVAKILELVHIGDNLKELQKEVVHVFVADTGVVNQHAWSKPQTADVHRQIDKMVAAGVLRRIDPADVKCVNPITLAEKD
ncbi:hypothetical protein K438DRAFT_1969283 [Mycena galopus ATCC 62051]|nr:hypothetical protein K438DRAFT_1969283 [Mycena galopus ATCC 62051]